MIRTSRCLESHFLSTIVVALLALGSVQTAHAESPPLPDSKPIIKAAPPIDMRPPVKFDWPFELDWEEQFLPGINWKNDPDSRVVRMRARDGDVDGDGLPDEWEIANAWRGVDPQVADFILIPVLRPDFARSRVIDTIVRVADFFKALPIVSPSGHTGIRVLVHWGNVLPPEFADSATPLLPYEDAYDKGMPDDLKGYGHGLLIGKGGGGNTSSADWAGVGNYYLTWIHELGHQLGLGQPIGGLNHTPANSGIHSAFYTSLMNYNYTGSFDGSVDKVHFSSGRFAGLVFDEKGLNEQVPFSSEALKFLTKPPYSFEVQATGPNSSNVDFNRNRTLGERNIRADLNDGWALNIGVPEARPEKSTGDVALAAVGPVLVALTTSMRRAWPHSYEGHGPSAINRGRLTYTTLWGQAKLHSDTLTEWSTVTGAPAMISHSNQLVIAYPSKDPYGYIGVIIEAFSVELSGQLSKKWSLNLPTPPDQSVQLVATDEPNAVTLLVHDGSPREDDGLPALVISGYRVPLDLTAPRIADLTVTNPIALPFRPTEPVVRIRSVSAPGATWNSKTGTLVLLTNDFSTASRGQQLNLQFFRRDGDGNWEQQGYNERIPNESLWLTYEGYHEGVRRPWTHSRTGERPVILFDPTFGDDGRYHVFYKDITPFAKDAGLLMSVKVMPPELITRSGPFRYRKKQIDSVWTKSRNAPAVTQYDDDYAIAWRTEKENDLRIHFGASGETDRIAPADFDDLSFIAHIGLHESLAKLR